MENKNLEALMGKIYNDRKTLEKLACMRNMRTMYDFCVNVQNGYTFDEFQEFFSELWKKYEQTVDFRQIRDKTLDKISGGGNNCLNKIAAATLGSLLLAPMQGQFLSGSCFRCAVSGKLCWLRSRTRQSLFA